MRKEEEQHHTTLRTARRAPNVITAQHPAVQHVNTDQKIAQLAPHNAVFSLVNIVLLNRNSFLEDGTYSLTSPESCSNGL